MLSKRFAKYKKSKTAGQLQWNGGFLVELYKKKLGKEHEKLSEELSTRSGREKRSARNISTKGGYVLLGHVPNSMLGVVSNVLKKTVQTLKHKTHSAP